MSVDRPFRRAGSRHLVAGGGLALVALVIVSFCVNAGVRLPCRDVCGSDIGRLYEDRGIDRAHAPFFQRDLEYPPVIGLVMYAAGYPFDRGMRGRFLVNALVLGALAAITTWMLWRRYGTATRRWALAPPLFIAGLTNWDLLAVAPATIGLLQWEAGNAMLAGLLIGAGACAKLFPMLYVPILAASCVRRRAWRRARGLLAGAAIGFGVFAIPVYAVAPDALRYFVTFHRVRGPSRGSIWFYLARGPASTLGLRHDDMVNSVNVITAMLVVAALVLLVITSARGRVSQIAACALATTAFIVTNKIYSPQYDLWLVPFLVMLPVRTRLVVHFYVSSFLVFVLIATEGHIVGRPLSLDILAAGVLYRLAVHVLIAREFWNHRLVGECPETRTPRPNGGRVASTGFSVR